MVNFDKFVTAKQESIEEARAKEVIQLKPRQKTIKRQERLDEARQLARQLAQYKRVVLTNNGKELVFIAGEQQVSVSSPDLAVRVRLYMFDLGFKIAVGRNEYILTR